MKKNSLITTVAVAVAGVAAYFIRKKIVARNSRTIEEPSSGDNRHITNAFSRAKSYSSGITDEV